jgi:hypothetical protein
MKSARPMGKLSTRKRILSQSCRPKSPARRRRVDGDSVGSVAANVAVMSVSGDLVS